MKTIKKTIELVCKNCGKIFLAKKKDAMYCSQNCQDISFRIRNKDRLKEKNCAYRENNREKIREYQRQNRKENPNKYRARSKVNSVIRSKKIIKPTQCQLCGNSTSLTAHHYLGYEKEHWLDIQWLCISCHKK